MEQPPMKMTDDQAKAVGTWIADARVRLHGWSQQTLAEAAGLSKAGLSNVETGRQGPRGWNPSTLASIEDALNIPRGTLLRIAEGDAVPAEDVRMQEDTGRILDQISRLADLVDSLERRISHLESRDE